MFSLDTHFVGEKRRTPEEKLWREVMMTALKDLKKKRQREQILRWVRSKSGHVGSFVYCCDVMGLDEFFVRNAIIQYADNLEDK